MSAKERMSDVRRSLATLGQTIEIIQRMKDLPNEEEIFKEHCLEVAGELTRSINDWDLHLTEKLR